MENNRNKLFLAILSGLLLGWSYSLKPSFIISWIASIPILYVGYNSIVKEGALYGVLTGIIASLFLFPYLIQLAGHAGALGMSILRGLQWGIMMGIFSYLIRKMPVYLRPFVFPMIFAAFDTTINFLSPHGSAGSIAYSQMEFSPILKAASYGGTPYVTFLVALISSVLVFLIIEEKKKYALLSIIFIIPLLMNPSREEKKSINLGLVATDLHKGVSEEWQGVWNDYKEFLLGEGLEEIDIILFPEKLFIIREDELEIFLEELKEFTKKNNLGIVIGLVENDGTKSYNRAYFVTETGQVKKYNKMHLIPGFEDKLKGGNVPLITDYKGIKIGLTICKDMDFPSTIRRYSSVDLMLVLAWDFDVDDWFHSRIASLRAVENGFTLARSARQGFLTVSDDQGKIISQKYAGKSDTTFLTQKLEVGNLSTFYSDKGDIFGWLSLGLTYLSLSIVADRKHKR